MELRPYQQSLINQIDDAWNQGAQNVLLQLPTGGGKTCVFCKIILNLQVPTVVIVHRMEIIGQISCTLAANGVPHNIITQRAKLKSIIRAHLQLHGASYFDATADVTVIGVDTLVEMSADAPWMARIKLVVQDEGHHVLRTNKWGRAAMYFPNARGLYPTATPRRADGYGLGRHADGLIDVMIQGLTMRQLINQGALSDYRIYAPASDVQLAGVAIGTTGDYSAPQLRTAVHKSHIVGDVVAHYQRIAPGKRGITFAVDIAAATEIAAAFRADGVPAEVITGKTPDLLRINILERFKAGDVLQLVNVDICGEGVDIPAVEVVSFARPTASLALYLQQFGRALRPAPGKTHAIIIDHVGNVLRHGLPDDLRRTWSLDRRDKRGAAGEDRVIPLRTCLQCYQIYTAVERRCPHCGFKPEPLGRTQPEQVDGDLTELDPATLAQLRGEAERIMAVARVPQHLPVPAQCAIVRRHNERRDAQIKLRAAIAQWAGYYKTHEKPYIYRLFYHTFKTDIAAAQTLNYTDATGLTALITAELDLLL